MNFYEAVLKYSKSDCELPFGDDRRAIFPNDSDESSKKFYQDITLDINKELGVGCDDDCAYSVIVWDHKEGEMKLIFAVDTDKSSVKFCKKYIKRYFEENFKIAEAVFECVSEITTSRFCQLGDKGDDNGYIRRFRSISGDIGINYRDNAYYKINEIVIPEETITKNKAMQMAKRIMADDSLIEEFERIYSDENEKRYYGNPVHYKISASSKDSAMEIANLLCRALKSNNRLAGSRMNSVYDIEAGCYDEDNFKRMFEINHGNVIVLDLSGNNTDCGNYASTYEDVIIYMDRLMEQNHVKTLCIFIENTEKPGFASSMLARVAEHIDIIELKEGSGTRQQALEFVEKLAKDNNYKVNRSELENIMPDKKVFTVGDAYAVYNKWFKDGLKNRFYKAYNSCSYMISRKEDKKSEPYDELQKMVGLQEIKKVIDEILDSARMQKLRSQMGMDSYKTSLHMVFTGNPGSAKTSVARLIAEILKKESILESGKFIECGRADLVGKYVGWTAKTVRSKFREAQGGVLFIDEAYSLVDDSNSFGDEAINTIVQEMENHRDDVIVIFAGYPEKMKDFLAKNEGLRSRIAFHLDFPDYNADELVGIFKLMASGKGYKYDDEVIGRCHDIFAQACKKDEFGNGRFVRNLLEQAMMAQAGRVLKEHRGRQVSRKAMVTFKAEDFEVNVSKQATKDKKQKIGFACGL